MSATLQLVPLIASSPLPSMSRWASVFVSGCSVSCRSAAAAAVTLRRTSRFGRARTLATSTVALDVARAPARTLRDAIATVALHVARRPVLALELTVAAVALHVARRAGRARVRAVALLAAPVAGLALGTRDTARRRHDAIRDGSRRGCGARVVSAGSEDDDEQGGEFHSSSSYRAARSGIGLRLALHFEQEPRTGLQLRLRQLESRERHVVE